MDMDSPEKAVETIREEDGTSFIGQPERNLLGNEDDQRSRSFMHESIVPDDGMQVYLDQEYPASPILHVSVDKEEELQSPIVKSNSTDLSSPAKNHREPFLLVESDLNHDDMERSFFDYGTEEQSFSMEDYQTNDDKKETDYAEPVAYPATFLDNNVNPTFNNEFHNENSYPLAHNSLLTGDNNNSYEMAGDEAFSHQISKSPALDEAETGDVENASTNFHSPALDEAETGDVENASTIFHSPALDEAETGDVENASTNFHSDKSEVHGELDGKSSSPHDEMKEADYSIIAAPENGGMVWENSSPRSPRRTQNASPSPERQFSISAERSRFQQSPHIHPSSKEGVQSPATVDKESAGVQSPATIDKKSAPSPSSCRQKRSPSPSKHDGARQRPSSRDHSSPTRRKSPAERLRRDSHHRDGPLRRHTASSPRKRDSPRKRARSISRSPVRKRDSPVRRRDHCRRSRSRSPHARGHYRRSPPRRRPSPRRRSPPSSYSGRRSSKRPWSPPANRNTGLGKPGNNLFVAGFSYVTTERDLEKKFSRFGRVRDIRVVRNKSSGESRGFGFISMDRDEDADAAIRAVDQTEWNGRVILVEKSKASTH